MFTNYLRPAFYVLLGVQVVILALAFFEELGSKFTIVSTSFERYGNWFYVLAAVWAALFLVTVVAILKKGAIPKTEAVSALLLIVVLAVLSAYLS